MAIQKNENVIKNPKLDMKNTYSWILRVIFWLKHITCKFKVVLLIKTYKMSLYSTLYDKIEFFI